MDVTAPRVTADDRPAPPAASRADAVVSIPIRPRHAQPVPEYALVRPTPDGRWTALLRAFRPGDSARCALCPAGSCVAIGDACLMVIPGRVADADAPLYSTLGMARIVGDD